jgi:phospholipid-binding lipoprotein MlaA
VRTVNFRHELLKADDLISDAALDKYTFVRDGYLQRRRNLVYDGNPPREKDPDDEEGEPKAGEGKGRPGAPAAGPDVNPPSAPKPAQ